MRKINYDKFCAKKILRVFNSKLIKTTVKFCIVMMKVEENCKCKKKIINRIYQVSIVALKK